MPQSKSRARKTRRRSHRARSSANDTARYAPVPSSEAIRAAEKLAMDAFASGLKVAAAFGTVAAKTTSLALASLASGADKFSELVRKEAGQSSASARKSPARAGMGRGKKPFRSTRPHIRGR